MLSVSTKIITMYSQNSEEKFITEYFSGKPDGKFIDLGGFHPLRFSNTRKLYEMGWNGVIVEPSEKCFQSFIKEYENEPRITLINAAIAEESGVIEFYESNGDAVSTTDIKHKEKWETGGNIKYQKMFVESISMKLFMHKYGHGTDFISLDTESTNMKLFRLIPDFVWQQISMIVVEHDGGMKEIEDKLSGWGFSTVHINAENIISAKL